MTFNLLTSLLIVISAKSFNVIGLIVGCLLFVALVGLFIWAQKYEKKRWHGGYCERCGEKWIQVDTDSQGGRMYSDINGHSCWMSYRYDK